MGFLEYFHHGLFSDIFKQPFPNIKVDQHLVMTVIVFVAWFDDYVRYSYAKKLPTKLQWKAIVDNFHRERMYERLEGQEGRRLSATKMNSKKTPAGGEWSQTNMRKLTSGYHNYPLKGFNLRYMYFSQKQFSE